MQILVSDENYKIFTKSVNAYLEEDFKVMPGTLVFLNGVYMVIVEEKEGE